MEKNIRTIDDNCFLLTTGSFAVLIVMVIVLNMLAIEADGNYAVKTLGVILSFSFALPGAYLWLKILSSSIKAKKYTRVLLLLMFNIIAALVYFWMDKKDR